MVEVVTRRDNARIPVHKVLLLTPGDPPPAESNPSLDEAYFVSNQRRVWACHLQHGGRGLFEPVPVVRDTDKTRSAAEGVAHALRDGFHRQVSHCKNQCLGHDVAG